MKKFIATVTLFVGLSTTAFSERQPGGMFEINVKNQNEFGTSVKLTPHSYQTNMLTITVTAPTNGRKGGHYSYAQIILKDEEKMLFYSRPDNESGHDDKVEISFLLDKSWLELAEVNLIYQTIDTLHPMSDPIDYHYSIKLQSFNGS